MIDKVKLKVLNKLFEHGYVNEKAITSFNLEDIKTIECYSAAEISKLIELKEAVKGNKVISFLSSCNDSE